MPSSDHVTGESHASLRLLVDPRLLAVVLLSLVGTTGNNVVAAALPAMGAGLGVPDARLGLVITAYTLPAMVAVPVAGLLADLYGRRTVVIPSLVLFGVVGTAIAGVGSFEAVLALRAVQGVAFAGIMPLSVTILGDLYDGPRGSAAQGVRVSVNGVGTILAPAAAGALSALAWNYPFALYAVALPAAVVIAVALPETVDRNRAADGRTAQLVAYGRTLGRQLRTPRLGSLLLGGGVRDFVRYGLITFVPLFAVRTMGASFAQAGLLLSVRGVAYILVSPLAGVIVGRLSRRGAIVGSLLLGATCLVLVPRAPGLLWVGLLVLGFSVGDSVFSPVIKDAVTDAASGDARAGVVAGMNVAKYAAQASSPAFFGLVLAAGGFDLVFEVGAAIAVGYAVVVWFFA